MTAGIVPASVSMRAMEIVRARAIAGVKETSRNRGPEIDGYHKRVGLDPAKRYAWCTSGLYDAFCVAAEELHAPNPFPKTAKAVRVWALRYEQCYEPDPAPGRVYVLDHGPPGNVLTEWRSGSYTDDGHIGIVLSLQPNGEVDEEGSANTNAAGSREGNCWAIHHGPPEVSHGGMLLGYLDLARWFVPAVS